MARALCLLLLAASAARADDAPRVRLDYVRGDGADACPDAAAMKRAVAARLGYQPFSTAAPRAISVEVRRDGRKLSSSLVLLDDGAPIGTRELAFVDDDCGEMREALVLALCIAIDPSSATRPAPSTPLFDDVVPPLPATALPDDAPTTDGRPSVATADALPPSSPTTRAVAREHARLVYGASAVVAPQLGATPGPNLAFRFGAEAGAAFFTMGLELALTVSTPVRVPSGVVLEGDVVLAGAVPCLRAWWTSLCGVVHGGVLRARGIDLQPSSTVYAPYASAGGRVGVDVPFSLGFDQSVVDGPPVWRLLAPFSLRLQGEIGAPLLIVRLTDPARDEVYWSSAPVVASIGAGVVAKFP